MSVLIVGSATYPDITAALADAVGGEDRLVVDYRAATATVIATTVSVTDGGIHSVTYDGFEALSLWTGAGNDTVTTGDVDSKVRTFAGNDTITIGDGRSVVSAG